MTKRSPLPAHLRDVAWLARCLGVTAETVRAWIRSGRLPAIRTPTGRYRLTTSTCASVIAERK